MSQGRIASFHTPGLPRDPRANFVAESTPGPVEKEIAQREKYARIVSTRIDVRLGASPAAAEIRALLGLAVDHG